MKKLLILFILLMTAAGCSLSIGVGDTSTKKEKGDLTLQVTKVDQDAGVTIENNGLYQELNKFIINNPKHGGANDFSVYVIDTVDVGDEKSLLLIAINRLNNPVKNILFDFTLGKDSGEFVWEKKPVGLDETAFGAIEPDHAIPFMLSVTPEQVELIKQINEENQAFKIDDFEYEVVKK